MRAWEFVTEHRLVFKRLPNGKVTMRWRCETGQKQGRTVPNVKDCSEPWDAARAQAMKKTRARTKIRQARKTKRTKRINPTSKLAQRLNKILWAMKKRKK